MADKPKNSKPVKAKAAKPTKAKSQKAAAPAPAKKSKAAAAGFFVSLPTSELKIHASKPTTGAKLVSVASFDEAKDLAIDHLIDLIDECERRLHAIRRAKSLSEFAKLVEK